MLRACASRAVFGGRQYFSSTVPLKEKIEVDAVIIGAGIMGSATALELQQKGLRTLVVDKDRGAGQGSTSYSTGIIRTYYSLEETTKIAYESSFYFSNWADYVQLPPSEIAEYVPCPSILLHSTQTAGWLDIVKSNHRKLDIPFEEWDVDRLKAEIKWMDWTSFYPPRRFDDPEFGEPCSPTLDKIEGSVVFRNASGFVSDPQLAASNVATKAKNEGASFLFRKEVTKILKGDSRIEGVELHDGTIISAPVVVNAAGPHSSLVTDMAYDQGAIQNDMRLTTRPLRVEVAHLPVPEEIPFTKENGFFLCDSNIGIYLRPDVKGKMVVGGQEPECDPLPFLNKGEYENAFDLSFTDEWEHHVYRANLRIPSLGVPNTSQAQGVVSAYDVTEDWVPVYDKSNIPGYFMCIGTSGNQFKNGPVVGKIMSSLICEAEKGRDTDREPFAFPLEKSGLGTLNLSMFSRLRDPCATSCTVMG